MKAIVLKALNELSFENIDNQPTIGLERIKILSSSLNHRDIWIKKGQYAGIKFPMVLGSDGVGLDENDNLVILNPSIQWGENSAFQSKEFQILGLPRYGTFSDECWVHKSQIFPLPTHLNIESAAALPLAGVTAFRALFKRANLQKSDKVLISGIGGGVALFAMQFAIAQGCEVYVTSSKEWKLDMAISMGAKGGKLYSDDNFVKGFQTELGGFDVIVDSAGGDGFSNLVKLANPGGRIVFYGGTNGNIQINPQLVFWKQISILGSTMGSDQDFTEMLEFVNFHKIIPKVDSIFPINEFDKAFKKMESGDQFGKIVLKV